MFSHLRHHTVLFTLLAVLLTAIASEAAEEMLGFDQNWSGDFEGMVERRRVRVLTPFSRTFYFLDGATQRGMIYEGTRLFEKWLNRKLKTGNRPVRVIVIPTARHELLSGLTEGRGDIAAANLTITAERHKLVDFSAPIARGVREIVVAGRRTEPLTSLDDLAGQKVLVRASSSYHNSLKELNEKFNREKKKRIRIILVDDNLEDEDLMEMAETGLISLTVVDEHKAVLWHKVFRNMTIYPDIALRTGGETGWAFRKMSPKLAQVVNEFLVAHGQKTLQFNILMMRYLQSVPKLQNSLSKKGFVEIITGRSIFHKIFGALRLRLAHGGGARLPGIAH